MFNQHYLLIPLEIIIITKILFKGIDKDRQDTTQIIYLTSSIILFLMSIILQIVLQIKKKGLIQNQIVVICMLIAFTKSLSIWFSSATTIEIVLQLQVIFQLQHFVLENSSTQLGESAILFSIVIYSFNLQNFFADSLDLFLFDVFLMLIDTVIISLSYREKRGYTQSDLSSRQELSNLPTQLKANIQITHLKQEEKQITDILKDQKYLLYKEGYVEYCNFLLQEFAIHSQETQSELIDLLLTLTIKDEQGNTELLGDFLKNQKLQINSYKTFLVQKNPLFDFHLYILAIIIDTQKSHIVVHFIRNPINPETEQKSQSQKSQELVHLARSLSHELGTSLNSIINFSNLAIQDESIPMNIQKNYIQPIQINSEQLNLIISNIRDYNLFYLNQFLLKFEEFDIQYELECVDKLIKDSIRSKKLKFEKTINLTQKLIVADKQRLKQVYFQLLQNAVKYTSKGQITVNIEGGASLVLISVSDTGIGMNEYEQERMTKLLRSSQFIKVSKNSVGSGIGIQISNQIVKQMNNKRMPIKYTTNANGSNFTFFINNNFDQLQNQLFCGATQSKRDFKSSKSIARFVSINSYIENNSSAGPIRKVSAKHNLSISLQNEQSDNSQDFEYVSQFGHQKEEEKPSIQIPPPCLSAKFMKNSLRKGCCSKILIVDDEYFNIQCLQLLLKKYIPQCDSAYNGLEALEMVEQKLNKPCNVCYNKFYSIIFLDVNMPIMDGIQTVSQLREWMYKNKIPKTICIANTGFNDFDIRIKCQEAGMDFFLTKPLEQSFIEQIIETMFPELKY